MAIKSALVWMKNEIISVLPAIIYFAIIFNLIHLTYKITLQPGERQYFTYASVTLIAIILGKVILIANALPFFNAFPKRPLVYNIVWKFFLYSIVVLIVSLLHIFLQHAIKYSSAAAMTKVIHEFSSPVFWAVEIWIAITLLGYIVFCEFAEVIGKKAVARMLFVKREL